MPPFLEVEESAAKNGGVYLNFPFGIGESLLQITSRGMRILVSGLLTAVYKRLRGLPKQLEHPFPHCFSPSLSCYLFPFLELSEGIFFPPTDLLLDQNRSIPSTNQPSLPLCPLLNS
jgi:hypothetical protein